MPSLKPYQEEGVRFILSRRATLLADEMGLGKSGVSIMAWARGADSQMLHVICPAYLRFNWEREFKFWLPDYNTSRLVVRSYDSLRKGTDDSEQPSFLVLDEAHYIKNQSSQRWQNIEPIASKAKRLVFLTGTPIPNRVKELFPLLCLLDPARWDPPQRQSLYARLPSHLVALPEEKKTYRNDKNFLSFAQRYCGMTTKETGKRVFREGQWQNQRARDFDGASNLEELGRILRQTVMLRRTKAEVLKDLPPKRRQLIVFPNPQTTSEVDTLEVSEENYDDVVKRLHSDKVLFKKWSETRHKQGKDKVPLVLEHLADCLASGSRKIIVFAHHRDVLEHLYSVLQFDGAVLVHGEHSELQRKDAIDIFQDDPNCSFFVGSIGASGTGVNLTASSHVVFAEFDPAPYRLLQAEDRAHRMGQKNMVLVQHLVWDGTLDAKMAQIVVKKQEVIREVI
jgi:SWI/SNF-related matrix-associated actin-dependent regulator 1 of chromatin subfamily A